MRANCPAVSCSALRSRARWCIGRALVLADEPTGNLDGRTAQQMLRLLREQLHGNSASAILITHSLAAARSADRILELAAGSCGRRRWRRQLSPHERQRGGARAGSPGARSPTRTGVSIRCSCWQRLRQSRWAWRSGWRCTWSTAPRWSEFDQATRRLVGSADIIVRGPPEGFDETLFMALATNRRSARPARCWSSNLTRPGHDSPLKLLALDPFRAAALQPQLHGCDRRRCYAAVCPRQHRAESRRRQTSCSCSAAMSCRSPGGGPKSLHIVDILSDGVYPDSLGIMDIATAQWSLSASAASTGSTCGHGPGST